MDRNDSRGKIKTTAATTRIAKLSSVLLTSAVAAVLIGAFAVTPSYGQASSDTERFSIPFEFTGTPFCGGEEVQFTGRANFVVHSTTGPDGEFQYTISHLNYQGATGVGLTSGDKYAISQSENAVSNVRQISANEFQFVNHATIISQGKELNTLVELLVHVTTDANGRVTAEIVDFDLKCVG